MRHDLQTYYGLSALPFTKEIPTDALLRLPSLEQALRTLLLLIETRGIGVMTGKSGTGKSCLLRMLENELHTGLYKVLYLCHTSVGIHEFYTHLLHALGLETGHRRAAMFRAIKQRILHLAKESRIHPVLLIDEAHYTNFFSFQT
jgi:type II secretory pathway predicted ATPase ExeA